MNRSVAIYLLIFICACTWAHAQEPSYDFKYFSDEDGLSSQFVNSIIQDNDGFMWFGTNFGLNRFDGENFESFTKNNSNLKHDRVVEIFEDVDGKIWNIFFTNSFSREYSISIFDPLLKKAKDFQDVFPKVSFQEKEISLNSFYQKGIDIWFCTTDGSIYKYDGKFTLFAKNESYQGSKIRIFDDGCWLAKKGYLIQLDKEGKEQKRISILDKDVWDFGLNARGRLWVAFHNSREVHNQIQVFSHNHHKNRIVEFHDDGWEGNVYNLQYFINENGEDRFLFLGKEIMKIFDERGILITNLAPQVLEKNPNFISNVVFQDKEKNFWVNAYNKVLLLSPRKKLFKKHFADAYYSIRGITRINEKKLFVTTYSGFYILDEITKEKEKIVSDSIHYYGLGIVKVGDEILVGIHSNRYLSCNFKTKEFNFYIQQIDNNIYSFFIDKNQAIWVLTNKGLLHLDHEKKEVFYPNNADLNHPIYQTEIYHIFENEDGLWIASSEGVYLINHSGTVLNHVELLDSYQINFFYQNSKDEFWLTTKGNGLLYWNKKTNKLKRFTVKDGLSHDYLYSIDKDKLGFFWIPSNNGLMRFNPSDFSINIFTEANGLTNNEFNTHSRFIDEEGMIYLGGVDGMISFNPSDFSFIDKKNLPLRILSFTKMKKNRKEVVDKTIELDNQKVIHFYPEDKSISLTFSLIDFNNNGQSKYAYQIEGHDKSWNYLKENNLRINRLPYGKYQLKIKGQSKYGKWSNQQITLPLIIFKPFYLTTWFLVFSILLLVGVVYGLFRYRIYRLEKEKRKLEKIVDERTKELAEQAKKLKEYNQMKDEFFAIIAHDLRGPIISFQGISKKIKFLNEEGNQKDVDGMLELVDTAAEDINTLLDNLLNWALLQKGIFPYYPHFLNLKEVSDETVQLFNPTAQIKGVQIEQNICEQVLIKADKDAMSMILRNMIGNAIKYSSEGDLVKINATSINGNVLLQIEDSGVGIPPEIIGDLFELKGEKIRRGTDGEKGSGLGLVLCKELIELNKGSIEVKSQLGKGTTFSIFLPRN